VEENLPVDTVERIGSINGEQLPTAPFQEGNRVNILEPERGYRSLGLLSVRLRQRKGTRERRRYVRDPEKSSLFLASK